MKPVTAPVIIENLVFSSWKEDKHKGESHKYIDFYLVTDTGNEVLAVSAEDHGNSHYVYQSTGTFAKFGALNSKNRADTISWLEMVIKESQVQVDQRLAEEVARAGLPTRDNPLGLYYTTHTSDRKVNPDGTHIQQYFLLDQYGTWHLAVVGEERESRDGHYLYKAADEFAARHPLHCHAQKDVIHWLEQRITHHLPAAPPGAPALAAPRQVLPPPSPPPAAAQGPAAQQQHPPQQPALPASQSSAGGTPSLAAAQTGAPWLPGGLETTGQISVPAAPEPPPLPPPSHAGAAAGQVGAGATGPSGDAGGGTAGGGDAADALDTTWLLPPLEDMSLGDLPQTGWDNPPAAAAAAAPDMQQPQHPQPQQQPSQNGPVSAGWQQQEATGGGGVREGAAGIVSGAVLNAAPGPVICQELPSGAAVDGSGQLAAAAATHGGVPERDGGSGAMGASDAASAAGVSASGHEVLASSANGAGHLDGPGVPDAVDDRALLGCPTSTGELVGGGGASAAEGPPFAAAGAQLSVAGSQSGDVGAAQGSGGTAVIATASAAAAFGAGIVSQGGSHDAGVAPPLPPPTPVDPVPGASGDDAAGSGRLTTSRPVDVAGPSAACDGSAGRPGVDISNGGADVAAPAGSSAPQAVPANMTGVGPPETTNIALQDSAPLLYVGVAAPMGVEPMDVDAAPPSGISGGTGLVDHVALPHATPGPPQDITASSSLPASVAHASEPSADVSAGALRFPTPAAQSMPGDVSGVSALSQPEQQQKPESPSPHQRPSALPPAPQLQKEPDSTALNQQHLQQQQLTMQGQALQSVGINLPQSLQPPLQGTVMQSVIPAQLQSGAQPSPAQLQPPVSTATGGQPGAQEPLMATGVSSNPAQQQMQSAQLQQAQGVAVAMQQQQQQQFQLPFSFPVQQMQQLLLQAQQSGAAPNPQSSPPLPQQGPLGLMAGPLSAAAGSGGPNGGLQPSNTGSHHTQLTQQNPMMSFQGHMQLPAPAALQLPFQTSSVAGGSNSLQLSPALQQHFLQHQQLQQLHLQQFQHQQLQQLLQATASGAFALQQRSMGMASGHSPFPQSSQMQAPSPASALPPLPALPPAGQAWTQLDNASGGLANAPSAMMAHGTLPAAPSPSLPPGLAPPGTTSAGSLQPMGSGLGRSLAHLGVGPAIGPGSDGGAVAGSSDLTMTHAHGAMCPGGSSVDVTAAPGSVTGLGGSGSAALPSPSFFPPQPVAQGLPQQGQPACAPGANDGTVGGMLSGGGGVVATDVGMLHGGGSTPVAFGTPIGGMPPGAVLTPAAGFGAGDMSAVVGGLPLPPQQPQQGPLTGVRAKEVHHTGGRGGCGGRGSGSKHKLAGVAEVAHKRKLARLAAAGEEAVRVAQGAYLASLRHAALSEAAQQEALRKCIASWVRGQISEDEKNVSGWHDSLNQLLRSAHRNRTVMLPFLSHDQLLEVTRGSAEAISVLASSRIHDPAAFPMAPVTTAPRASTAGTPIASTPLPTLSGLLTQPRATAPPPATHTAEGAAGGTTSLSYEAEQLAAVSFVKALLMEDKEAPRPPPPVASTPPPDAAPSAPVGTSAGAGGDPQPCPTVNPSASSWLHSTIPSPALGGNGNTGGSTALATSSGSGLLGSHVLGPPPSQTPAGSLGEGIGPGSGLSPASSPFPADGVQQGGHQSVAPGGSCPPAACADVEMQDAAATVVTDSSIAESQQPPSVLPATMHAGGHSAGLMAGRPTATLASEGVASAVPVVGGQMLPQDPRSSGSGGGVAASALPQPGKPVGPVGGAATVACAGSACTWPYGDPHLTRHGVRAALESLREVAALCPPIASMATSGLVETVKQYVSHPHPAVSGLAKELLKRWRGTLIHRLRSMSDARCYQDPVAVLEARIQANEIVFPSIADMLGAPRSSSVPADGGATPGGTAATTPLSPLAPPSVGATTPSGTAMFASGHNTQMPPSAATTPMLTLPAPGTGHGLMSTGEPIIPAAVTALATSNHLMAVNDAAHVGAVSSPGAVDGVSGPAHAGERSSPAAPNVGPRGLFDAASTASAAGLSNVRTPQLFSRSAAGGAAVAPLPAPEFHHLMQSSGLAPPPQLATLAALTPPPQLTSSSRAMAATTSPSAAGGPLGAAAAPLASRPHPGQRPPPESPGLATAAGYLTATTANAHSSIPSRLHAAAAQAPPPRSPRGAPETAAGPRPPPGMSPKAAASTAGPASAPSTTLPSPRLPATAARPVVITAPLPPSLPHSMQPDPTAEVAALLAASAQSLAGHLRPGGGNGSGLPLTFTTAQLNQLSALAASTTAYLNASRHAAAGSGGASYGAVVASARETMEQQYRQLQQGLGLSHLSLGLSGGSGNATTNGMPPPRPLFMQAPAKPLVQTAAGVAAAAAAAAATASTLPLAQEPLKIQPLQLQPPTQSAAALPAGSSPGPILSPGAAASTRAPMGPRLGLPTPGRPLQRVVLPPAPHGVKAVAAAAPRDAAGALPAPPATQQQQQEQHLQHTSMSPAPAMQASAAGADMGASAGGTKAPDTASATTASSLLAEPAVTGEPAA